MTTGSVAPVETGRASPPLPPADARVSTPPVGPKHLRRNAATNEGHEDNNALRLRYRRSVGRDPNGTDPADHERSSDIAVVGRAVAAGPGDAPASAHRRPGNVVTHGA